MDHGAGDVMGVPQLYSYNASFLIVTKGRCCGCYRHSVDAHAFIGAEEAESIVAVEDFSISVLKDGVDSNNAPWAWLVSRLQFLF